MTYNPTRPVIDAKSIAPLVMESGALMVAEFRGFTVEKIEYTDSKSGKPTHFIKATASVEVGKEARQVMVEVRLPREVDKKEDVVSVGCVKGQTVLLRLLSIATVKGNTTASVGPEDNAIVIVKG